MPCGRVRPVVPPGASARGRRCRLRLARTGSGAKANRRGSKTRCWRLVLEGRTAYAPGRQDLIRDMETVVANYFSMSWAAPRLFGDRLADFEADLRRVLSECSPDGLFWDWPGDTELVIATKPSGFYNREREAAGSGSRASTWPSRNKAVGGPSEIHRASLRANRSTYHPSSRIPPRSLTNDVSVSRGSPGLCPPTPGAGRWSMGFEHRHCLPVDDREGPYGP
jgi:hypothetical protein